MTIDYGNIHVRLQKGLEKDQKITCIKNTVENQLFARNRQHCIEILRCCFAIVNVLDDGVPFENKFNNFVFKYTLKLDYFDSKKCLQCINGISKV